jgi:hypothetical protein
MNSNRSITKTAIAISIAECKRGFQPQRGCLFIVGHELDTPSFCFSAAHGRRSEINRYVLRCGNHSRLLAPPKNKKNKGLGGGSCYKQVTPLGWKDGGYPERLKGRESSIERSLAF